MTVSYKVVAGDTLSYLTDAPTGDGVTYYPGDGWTLKYRLIPRVATSGVIDLTASTEGTGYRIAAAAADTASWTAGYYSAAAWVEQGTEKYTVEPAFEQVQILADPRTVAAGFEGRSDTAKALDDARTALFNAQATAASGSGNVVQEYRIGDRMMKYADAQTATASLVNMVQYLEREVARERRAEAIRRGLADPRKVFIRSGRV